MVLDVLRSYGLDKHRGIYRNLFDIVSFRNIREVLIQFHSNFAISVSSLRILISLQTEVGLRFAGDDTVHPIPRSKVVKISGHNGNSRVLAVGKEKAKSLLAAMGAGSRPADDSGT